MSLEEVLGRINEGTTSGRRGRGKQKRRWSRSG